MGQNGSFAPFPPRDPPLLPPIADAALPRGCPACGRHHFPVLPRLRPEEILQIVTLCPPGTAGLSRCAPPCCAPHPGVSRSVPVSPTFPHCHPNKVSHSPPAARPHLSAVPRFSPPPGGDIGVLNSPSPQNGGIGGGEAREGGGGGGVTPTWRSRPQHGGTHGGPWEVTSVLGLPRRDFLLRDQ